MSNNHCSRCGDFIETPSTSESQDLFCITCAPWNLDSRLFDYDSVQEISFYAFISLLRPSKIKVLIAFAVALGISVTFFFLSVFGPNSARFFCLGLPACLVCLSLVSQLLILDVLSFVISEKSMRPSFSLSEIRSRIMLFSPLTILLFIEFLVFLLLSKLAPGGQKSALTFGYAILIQTTVYFDWIANIEYALLNHSSSGKALRNAAPTALTDWLAIPTWLLASGFTTLLAITIAIVPTGQYLQNQLLNLMPIAVGPFVYAIVTTPFLTAFRIHEHNFRKPALTMFENEIIKQHHYVPR